MSAGKAYEHYESSAEKTENGLGVSNLVRACVFFKTPSLQSLKDHRLTVRPRNA